MISRTGRDMFPRFCKLLGVKGGGTGGGPGGSQHGNKEIENSKHSKPDPGVECGPDGIDIHADQIEDTAARLRAGGRYFCQKAVSFGTAQPALSRFETSKTWRGAKYQHKKRGVCCCSTRC